VAAYIQESRTADAARTVATVLHPDAILQPVAVLGDDADRFATIRKIVGGSVTTVLIDDQDGPAALGWVNGSSRGLAANPVASALVDRPIYGPTVITGLGHGDEEYHQLDSSGIAACTRADGPRRAAPPRQLAASETTASQLGSRVPVFALSSRS
jgi:hypothetical protein